MNSKARVFGSNLYYFIKKNKMDMEMLANELGFSSKDLYKIIDARVFIPQKEKQAIADCIGVELGDLLAEITKEDIDEPLIECRGAFTSEDNKNLILDLFDAYCDIQEMIEREKTI